MMELEHIDGGVRGRQRTYRIGRNGKRIIGCQVPAFISNGGYHLIDLGIYQDGIIDCWGLVDFEGFKEKVAAGWVTAEVPAGAKISKHQLFYGTAEGLTFYVTNEDLVKEVKACIALLQRKHTPADTCWQAFERFIKHPTEEDRATIAESFEQVAEHTRQYILGHQDWKAGPLKLIIARRETSEDLENWRHDFEV